MKKADFVKAIEDALGDDGSPLTPHSEAIAAHAAIDYWQQQAFTMAAGQCCVKSGGLMADDHGHQFCDMERQRDEWKRKAEEAIAIAGLLFDAWEDGMPCYETDGESGMGASIGNAFRLSDEDFTRCTEFLNRVDPRGAAIAAKGKP